MTLSHSSGPKIVEVAVMRPMRSTASLRDDLFHTEGSTPIQRKPGATLLRVVRELAELFGLGNERADSADSEIGTPRDVPLLYFSFEPSISGVRPWKSAHVNWFRDRSNPCS